MCLVEGPGSAAFAITFVVAAVVMYDAMGVRQHAGRQAAVINALVVTLPPEHPIQDHEHAGNHSMSPCGNGIVMKGIRE